MKNCLNEDLLDFEDVESNEKLELSTSRKIDVILRTVVRNINEASEFEKLLKLLDEDEHQHHIVERLKIPVQPGWIDDGNTYRVFLKSYMIRHFEICYIYS